VAVAPFARGIGFRALVAEWRLPFAGRGPVPPEEPR
jgi:hypothetical protein